MLILALAAAVQPQPSELRTFRDWIVGCDNGRVCQAVALMPENQWDGVLTMTVRRGPDADALPTITINAAGDRPLEPAQVLLADGKATGFYLTADGRGATIAPADVPAAIALFRSARRLTLGSETVSLMGATAAFLYMDEAQQRIGTRTALVHAGDRPFDAPPPEVPVVRVAAISGPPLTLGADEVQALRTREDCLIEDVGAPDEVEVHALDAKRSLVLLACGTGAYNLTQLPFLATRANGALSIVPAPFDRAPVWGEPGSKPALVNASFEDGVLSDYAKGRGIGDCGIASDYVWDGERFRLTRQAEMNECRGAYDYIVTWRAEVEPAN